ncbi:MAG: hypothetical protein A2X08_06675 [Bacteroidetes bacterium GWA2_32_17]|nr:MAG: hypothetical protein A2X08_06675 [Bacteroidetes bacterium GWA2_32_17]
MYLRALCFLFLCLFSCSQENPVEKTDVTSENIAAIVDNKPIYLTDVDKLNKQELYDQLYRIYIIRKTTINEIFKESILKFESNKHNKSVHDYLENYYNLKINDNSLKNFIKKMNLNAIPDLKRTLNYYDINSDKGRALVFEGFKKYLKSILIDSLYAIYKPKILIEPPLPPEINLNKIPTHYRGNLDSKVTFLEVTDMECDKCREFEPVYEKLFKKYKNKVRFGFIHFSSYVTLCATATECATKQNKFWEMRDIIMNQPKLPDTADVFLIAKKLNLNMELFTKNFYDPETSSKIEYNFKLLKYCGLFGTPTILINGIPIFNSSSQKEIEKVLEKELE